MDNLKRQNAITLVALVITIIILLILAGISIQALTNQGIFGKAQEAKQKSEKAEREQSKILDEYEKELNKYTSKELTTTDTGIVLSNNENVELHDKNGSKIVVPAGFKVVNTWDLTVEKGIVVEDSRGNQYVWIPCTTENSNTQLQYKRTEWDVEFDGEDNTRASKDELTLTNIKCNAIDKQYGLTDEKVAEILAQVKSEKESVTKYGGYYIGRYETGNEDNIAVIKYNQIPYTGIDWKTAYSLAREIDGGSGAITYLCSSYAWDTAINFIQNNDTKNYATIRDGLNENWKDKEVLSVDGRIIKHVNTEQMLETGKTTAKCNIFDMGANVAEYTTEIMPSTSEQLVLRGGNYIYYDTAGRRYDTFVAASFKFYGFRTTLFLK